MHYRNGGGDAARRGMEILLPLSADSERCHRSGISHYG
jgi:hypothetical protein